MVHMYVSLQECEGVFPDTFKIFKQYFLTFKVWSMLIVIKGYGTCVLCIHHHNHKFSVLFQKWTHRFSVVLICWPPTLSKYTIVKLQTQSKIDSWLYFHMVTRTRTTINPTQILPEGAVLGCYILQVALSYQKNKIAPLKIPDTPPPSPPTMIYLGVNFTFLPEGVVLGLWGR